MEDHGHGGQRRQFKTAIERQQVSRHTGRHHRPEGHKPEGEKRLFPLLHLHVLKRVDAGGCIEQQDRAEEIASHAVQNKIQVNPLRQWEQAQRRAPEQGRQRQQVRRGQHNRVNAPPPLPFHGDGGNRDSRQYRKEYGTQQHEITPKSSGSTDTENRKRNRQRALTDFTRTWKAPAESGPSSPRRTGPERDCTP